MSEKARFEIQLSLNGMAELFAEPAADPFDAASRYVSGIDEVVAQMRLQPRDLDDPSRLTIRLPKTAVSPETHATLKAALARYCTAKIVENQQTIDELRGSSRRQAISALVLVIVLFIFTLFLVSAIPELQTISGAIAGFLGIATWVIFWDPIYNYVYAWRPNRMDIKVFSNLLATDLVVVGV